LGEIQTHFALGFRRLSSAPSGGHAASKHQKGKRGISSRFTPLAAFLRNPHSITLIGSEPQLHLLSETGGCKKPFSIPAIVNLIILLNFFLEMEMISTTHFIIST